MRGVYATVTPAAIGDFGSSPHAWGLHWTETKSRTIPRFIPTCVGFTDRYVAGAVAIPVHPHMRGVYDWAIKNGYEENGSSPHAWGLPQQGRDQWYHYRFIPTCVGFTGMTQIAVVTHTVHPHMRGVYTKE